VNLEFGKHIDKFFFSLFLGHSKIYGIFWIKIKGSGGIGLPDFIMLVFHKFLMDPFDLGKEALYLCYVHNNCSRYRQFHPVPLDIAKGNGYHLIRPGFGILKRLTFPKFKNFGKVRVEFFYISWCIKELS